MAQNVKQATGSGTKATWKIWYRPVELYRSPRGPFWEVSDEVQDQVRAAGMALFSWAHGSKGIPDDFGATSFTSELNHALPSMLADFEGGG
jgi:hypothetical protein